MSTATRPITTFPELLRSLAGAEMPRRNELGKLVRVEFVAVPSLTFFEPPTKHVAFFFDDGLRPQVLRTYQPQRRD